MFMKKRRSPIKVLHILDELSHSGAEVMLQLAYRRFEATGIDSHILSTGDYIGAFAAIVGQTGYKVHHIPFRKRIGFFKDIYRLLKTEKFTVVHIHTERAFIWHVLLAKLAGVHTIVRTFHGVFLFFSYLRWKRQWQRSISQKLLGTVHTAISDSVLATEKDRFENNCILIRNWTDPEKFRPPTDKERAASRHLYNLESEDFVLVTIGGCTPLKNHLDICAAVKKVNGLTSGRKVVFLHLGAGPMMEEEQMYVRGHQLQQYCRFAGTLDDVRPCLYAADAFVMTSRWEGLGNAALEAMSTALPVVLYNVPGLRDLLQDGRGGLLIEPNADSLVNALLFMINHPELHKVQAQEARDVILRTYSLEDSVDKFIGIYKTGNCKYVEEGTTPS
jgi:glycosyltransferase involved in cell wall biosynthesis